MPSSIDALAASNASTAASQVARQKSGPDGLMANSDTFMKLLTANLRHQDPMAPQDSSAFMAQLSQMTMVEQLTELSKGSAAGAQSAHQTQVLALLGRQVTWLDADGTQKTGLVEAVDTSTDKPTLTVGGTGGIDPVRVSEVRPA